MWFSANHTQLWEGRKQISFSCVQLERIAYGKMNKPTMILLFISLALHMFQVIAVDKITISPSSKTSTTFQNINESQHSPLVCFDNPGTYNSRRIICSQSGPLLAYYFCATYNEHTKVLSLIKCPYFQPNVINITTAEYIQLPRNLSQLNDYMCGPLNRKGLVCRWLWSLSDLILVQMYELHQYLVWSATLPDS